MVTTSTKKLNQRLKKLLHMPRSEISGGISVGKGRSFSSSNSEFSYSLSSEMSVDGGEANEEARWSNNAPKDVPVGCLPVYVGQERRRFVIPTGYLSSSIFRALLAKSEEEYGLRCDGGLRIACAPDVFEHFLWWLEGDGTDCSEELMKSSCSN